MVEEVKANVTEGKDEKVVEKAEIVKTESVEEPLQVSITHEDHAGNNSISGYTDNTTSGVFHADITWKCRTCSKTFASEELVKQHVLMFHLMERFDKTAPKDLKIYSCDQCHKYSTTSRVSYIKHLGMLHQAVPDQVKKIYKGESYRTVEWPSFFLIGPGSS